MIMRYTVTPPIDDEMEGDYWSRMNPRDDRVPLGCHLNLDEDDDSEEDDQADLGLPLELEDEDDDDADDDVGSLTMGASASSSPVTERRLRPLAGSAFWDQSLTQLIHPLPRDVPGAPSEPIPIASGAGVKRALSEDQLRASNKLAEYRDFIMFQVRHAFIHFGSILLHHYAARTHSPHVSTLG
jgi:hypothetical protein